MDPARSAQMARVRGKDTKPELRVRQALHRAGLRFRLHDGALPGKPDIVLPSRKAVVLVHGCFWHRHASPTCRLARLPKTRLEFWEPKLAANAARDELKRTELERLGWRVLVAWECEIKTQAELTRLVDTVKALAVRPRHPRKA